MVHPTKESMLLKLLIKKHKLKGTDYERIDVGEMPLCHLCPDIKPNKEKLIRDTIDAISRCYK